MQVVSVETDPQHHPNLQVEGRQSTGVRCALMTVSVAWRSMQCVVYFKFILADIAVYHRDNSIPLTRRRANE